MKAGIISSEQIADGSCMRAIRFLGGQCDHYEGCKYRHTDTGCNATSLRLHELRQREAKVRADLETLEERHRIEGNSIPADVITL